MKQIIRDKCVISQTKDLEDIYSIEDFPIYPGVTDESSDHDLVAKLTFSISKSSGMIQLRELVPEEILYEKSHNASFGKIWEEHHRQFAEFVSRQCPKSILEIGGGNGRLGLYFSEINHSSKWLILEPSDIAPLDGCKCEYLRTFFDNEKGCSLPEGYWIDTIVHSHLLEHVYEPLAFVRSCSDMLDWGGQMIFTLPNMSEYLKRKYSNAIFFEHTYFITEPYIEWLLAQGGFRVKEKRYFGDGHSIFYATVKDSRVVPYELPKNLYDTNLELFKEFIEYHEEMVKNINDKLDNANSGVYLFGAHIFTQYLIKFGMHTEKVLCVLDNDPKKQGRRFYGTEFMVHSPDLLKGVEKPVVIVRMGAYTEEIVKGLLEINNTVQIL